MPTLWENLSTSESALTLLETAAEIKETFKRYPWYIWIRYLQHIINSCVGDRSAVGKLYLEQAYNQYAEILLSFIEIGYPIFTDNFCFLQCDQKLPGFCGEKSLIQYKYDLLLSKTKAQTISRIVPYMNRWGIQNKYTANMNEFTNYIPYQDWNEITIEADNFKIYCNSPSGKCSYEQTKDENLFDTSSGFQFAFDLSNMSKCHRSHTGIPLKPSVKEFREKNKPHIFPSDFRFAFDTESSNSSSRNLSPLSRLAVINAKLQENSTRQNDQSPFFSDNSLSSEDSWRFQTSLNNINVVKKNDKIIKRNITITHTSNINRETSESDLSKNNQTRKIFGSNLISDFKINSQLDKNYIPKTEILEHQLLNKNIMKGIINKNVEDNSVQRRYITNNINIQNNSESKDILYDSEKNSTDYNKYNPNNILQNRNTDLSIISDIPDLSIKTEQSHSSFQKWKENIAPLTFVSNKSNHIDNNTEENRNNLNIIRYKTEDLLNNSQNIQTTKEINHNNKNIEGKNERYTNLSEQISNIKRSAKKIIDNSSNSQETLSDSTVVTNNVDRLQSVSIRTQNIDIARKTTPENLNIKQSENNKHKSDSVESLTPDSVKNKHILKQKCLAHYDSSQVLEQDINLSNQNLLKNNKNISHLTVNQFKEKLLENFETERQNYNDTHDSKQPRYTEIENYCQENHLLVNDVISPNNSNLLHLESEPYIYNMDKSDNQLELSDMDSNDYKTSYLNKKLKTPKHSKNSKISSQMNIFNDIPFTDQEQLCYNLKSESNSYIDNQNNYYRESQASSPYTISNQNSPDKSKYNEKKEKLVYRSPKNYISENEALAYTSNIINDLPETFLQELTKEKKLWRSSLPHISDILENYQPKYPIVATCRADEMWESLVINPRSPIARNVLEDILAFVRLRLLEFLNNHEYCSKDMIFKALIGEYKPLQDRRWKLEREAYKTLCTRSQLRLETLKFLKISLWLNEDFAVSAYKKLHSCNYTLSTLETAELRHSIAECVTLAGITEDRVKVNLYNFPDIVQESWCGVEQACAYNDYREENLQFSNKGSVILYWSHPSILLSSYDICSNQISSIMASVHYCSTGQLGVVLSGYIQTLLHELSAAIFLIQLARSALAECSVRSSQIERTPVITAMNIIPVSSTWTPLIEPDLNSTSGYNEVPADILFDVGTTAKNISQIRNQLRDLCRLRFDALSLLRQITIIITFNVIPSIILKVDEAHSKVLTVAELRNTVTGAIAESFHDYDLLNTKTIALLSATARVAFLLVRASDNIFNKMSRILSSKSQFLADNYEIDVQSIISITGALKVQWESVTRSLKLQIPQLDTVIY